MVENEKIDPLYWVQRASDVRGEAKKMKDPVAKHYMERFAEEYERLAQATQQIRVRRNVGSETLHGNLMPPVERPGVASDDKAATAAAEPVKIPQAVLDQFVSP